MLRDLKSISYSRLVKMFADGAVVILPSFGVKAGAL